MGWDNFISQDYLNSRSNCCQLSQSLAYQHVLWKSQGITSTHTQRCKELPNEISPPPPPLPPDQLRLGPLCTTSGNTGPSARQTPGAGPSTCRSTDYAPPLWCGHPKSHMYLSGIGQSQWSCPSPSETRFPIYCFYLGLGWVPSGEREMCLICLQL